MIALGLTILLVVFWGVVGMAALAVLAPEMSPLGRVLLSPVVGVVVTLLPVFAGSRMGVPVGRFAYGLTVFMLVVAGLVLAVARPRVPWRQYLPFGLVFVGGLLLVVWPFFEFGLDWLSLCNPDMGQYCLAGLRFFHHGFYDVPSLAELLGGRDYSQYYWFLHVPAKARPGSELLIAWAMGLSGMNPHEVFMPLISAFHVVMLSATAALVYQSPELRTAALAAAVLLAASALGALGLLNQLIGQEIGLAMLAACALLLFRPGLYSDPAAPPGGAPGARPVGRRRALLREGLLLGVTGTGLLVLYPEVLPILGASWIVFLLAGPVRRRQLSPRRTAAVFGLALGTALVLLWRYTPMVIGFVLSQITWGSTSDEVTRAYYPFYLLPSGAPTFWGFVTLTALPTDPLLSITIVAAWVMFVVAGVVVVWATLRAWPAACVTLVMALLVPMLFSRGSSFGLYKMAMFLQPFLLGTFALAWWYALGRRKVARPRGGWGAVRTVGGAALRMAPLVVLAAPGLLSQQRYVQASRGRGGVAFGEVADASGSRINRQFKAALDSNPAAAARGVISDTHNIVLSKLQQVYTRGDPASFVSVDPAMSLVDFGQQFLQFVPGRMRDTFHELRGEILAAEQKGAFELYPGTPGGERNQFIYHGMGPAAVAPVDGECLLVAEAGKQTVFNRYHLGGAEGEFVARRVGRVRNHLMFSDSEMGHGYFAQSPRIAVYQMEPDTTFYKKTTMAAAGRHLLFEVMGPSEKGRVVMEVSSSLNADGDNSLPPGSAIGATREKLGLSGRGSARVFSPPLATQVIGGRHFIALDLGRDPAPMRTPRTGLMKLYGEGVSLDYRRVVTFLRDVSFVSAETYDRLAPPSFISTFPADLRDPQLEYSGIYEDNWTSEHTWCALSEPFNAAEVVVRGFVPDLGNPGFQAQAVLRVDGVEVARKVIGLKGFELRAPVRRPQTQPAAAGSPAAPRRRVELLFSKLQSLPDPDSRPVGCQLEFFGFETTPSPPVKLERFPRDIEANPLLAPNGLYSDGWVSPAVSMRLTQAPGTDHLSLRGFVPFITDRGFTSELSILVDGNEVAKRSLPLGDFDIVAPVPPAPSSSARGVELRFTAAQPLPAPDDRKVGARLSFIGFTPPPLPPAALQQFPDDLKRPQVKPTGIYDDGWLAPTASLQLTQPAAADTLVIEAMVPKIGDRADFSTNLSVLVDGKEVARRRLGLDRFEWRLPAPAAAEPGDVLRRVELRSTDFQALPAPDGRTIWAKLVRIAFEPAGR